MNVDDTQGLLPAHTAFRNLILHPHMGESVRGAAGAGCDYWILAERDGGVRGWAERWSRAKRVDAGMGRGAISGASSVLTSLKDVLMEKELRTNSWRGRT